VGVILDQLIQIKENYKNKFLEKEQEKWLKKNKTIMPKEKLDELTTKADGQYLIEASRLSFSSHVCKFSHPDSKTSPVIAVGSFKNDGYLRSGNVVCKNENRLDVVRNAKSSPIGKFLLVIMEDGKTVIEHLKMDSAEIRRELETMQEDFVRLRAVFLAVKKNDQDQVSDERVKQVYFPVDDHYHLLSLLTSSLMVSEAKGRIEEIGKQVGQDYDVIRNLTVIRFGGDNPQNISELITRNNGKVYLLSSCPPSLSNRAVIRPRKDFFANTLRSASFTEDFRYLHDLFTYPRNNLSVRDKIKKILNGIIDNVMLSVDRLRKQGAGWSDADRYSKLPLVQKIWLDDIHAEMRNENEEWLGEVSLSFARWIRFTYEKILKHDCIRLGDGELAFFQELVETALKQDRET